VFPISTLPNERVVGDAPSRNVADDVAVPDRVIVGAVFGALLAIVIVPLNELAVAGANVTLKLTDWPAATVIGNVAGTKLNPVPDTVAPVTDIEVPPLLETLKLRVEVVPATILAKLRAGGVTAICAGAAETVTVAEADLVLSATLVALTV
jgi:hypothetical protein